MNPISKCPFAEVISHKEIIPTGNGFYRINLKDCKNCPTILMPGNLFILSNVKPKVLSDLQRYEKTWTFATILSRNGKKEEKNKPKCFSIKIWKNNFEMMDKKQPKFLVILANVLSNIRMWSALHMKRNNNKYSMCYKNKFRFQRGNTNSLIFNQVLGVNYSLDFGGCDVCKTEMKLSSDNDLFCTLNESQVGAIRTCLQKTSCVHKYGVELIWGPPGTGKTKTVGVLLFQLRKHNRRTLACAPTNTAIMQVWAVELEIFLSY